MIVSSIRSECSEWKEVVKEIKQPNPANQQEWYDFIEDLVSAYQSGNQDAGMQIVSAFRPYLTKYIRMLTDGLLDLNDIDSRKFISLFIANGEVRKHLVRNFHPTHVRNEAYRAASLLSKLCQPLPKEDIEQELVLVILTLATRYQKKGKKKNFCGYVYNSYRYELHRRLAHLTKDPIIFRAETNVSYHDETYDTYNEECEALSTINTEDTLIKVLEDDLDNSWIRGITCSDVFLSLTPLQRIIVKRYYYDGVKDPVIADETGFHKNTIFRQRTKAISVLREAYENM